MARSLNAPITDGGLEAVQFFNGRVLSAADLQDEQHANRLRRAQVARALGTGVAHGFQVEAIPGAAPQSLRVRAGLAISPSGDPVELFTDVEVSVVDIATEPQTTGQFVVCNALPSVETTGAGAYLLVACPAKTTREQVPRVNPIGDGGRAGSCGPRYSVEGVRFRVVHLDVGDPNLVPEAFRDELDDLMSGRPLGVADRSRQRNLLAHWCLGTSDQRMLPADLYDRLSGNEDFDAEAASYGPINALRVPETPEDTPRLSSHDVPLALFVWDDDSIQIVDMWAARRRIHRTGGSPEAITDRRRAEGEARLRQFQAHINDLLALPGPVRAAVQLWNYVPYLPPVGVIPERVPGISGFSPSTLFVGMTTRAPVYLEGGRLPSLVDRASLAPPVASGTRAGWWLYRLRENRVPESGAGQGRPYLVFSSMLLPFAADAQYNVARWDGANYESVGPYAAAEPPPDPSPSSPGSSTGGGSTGGSPTGPGATPAPSPSQPLPLDPSL